MKFGISNIGWNDPFDAEILTAIYASGARGIEVAPTKFFPGWGGISEQTISEKKKQIEGFGLCIPSMQSLFYGVEGLQSIFQSSEILLNHLKIVASMGEQLRAKVLVFGSPKLRIKDGEESRLLEIFKRAGDICKTHNIKLGIEPNPSEYGAQFWHSHSEVQTFVRKLNHPSVVLHMDAGALHMTHYELDFDPAPVHFHLSSPMLGRVTLDSIDHDKVKQQLQKLSYQGWHMVEMLPQSDGLIAIKEALSVFKQKYDKA